MMKEYFDVADKDDRHVSKERAVLEKGSGRRYDVSPVRINEKHAHVIAVVYFSVWRFGQNART
jgi:hypothetical protein